MGKWKTKAYAVLLVATAVSAGGLGYLIGRADEAMRWYNSGARMGKDQEVTKAEPIMVPEYRYDDYGLPVFRARPESETTFVIGEVVLISPSIINRIAGLTLHSKQAQFEVIVAVSNGTSSGARLLLSPRQVERIQAEVTTGAKAQVIPPRGESYVVPVRLQ